MAACQSVGFSNAFSGAVILRDDSGKSGEGALERDLSTIRGDCVACSLTPRVLEKIVGPTDALERWRLDEEGVGDWDVYLVTLSMV